MNAKRTQEGSVRGSRTLHVTASGRSARAAFIHVCGVHYCVPGTDPGAPETTIRYDSRDPKEAQCKWDYEDKNLKGRDHQVQQWAVMSDDADPNTGARTSANSFPGKGYSPETTSWFEDLTTVPGAPNPESSYDASTRAHGADFGVQHCMRD